MTRETKPTQDKHSRKTPAKHGEQQMRMAKNAGGSKKNEAGKGNWGDEVNGQLNGNEDGRHEAEYVTGNGRNSQ